MDKYLTYFDGIFPGFFSTPHTSLPDRCEKLRLEYAKKNYLYKTTASIDDSSDQHTSIFILPVYEFILLRPPESSFQRGICIRPNKNTKSRIQ